MNASETNIWHLLFPPGTHERDPDFRSVLTDILLTGLRQCGAIGLVGSLLYVGLSVLGLGYELNWTYEPVHSTDLEHRVVVTGILIVAALSVIGLVLAQMKCRLRTGRLFGLLAVLLVATVATFEGALRGVFGTEYVIPAYLVIVAIVPFHPRQVLGIGGAVALVVFVLGPSGIAWNGGVLLTAEMTKHLAYVGGSALLITGTSSALYRRYRAFGISQASLHKNRDLLRRVQSVAGVGGWEYDPETDEAEGTEELYRILDLPEETLLDGETGLRMYPPRARDSVQRAVKHSLETGTPFDVEVPLNTHGGERRWVHVRGKPRTRYDESVRLIGTLQDITALKERERQLKQERDRFETLFQNLPTPVVHGTFVDTGFRIRTVNHAFETAFGYERRSVRGKRMGSVFDLKTDQGDLERIIQKAFENGVLQTEVQLPTPDGPRHLQLHIAARHKTGARTEGYAMFVDITERRRHEQDLRERKRKIEALYTATDRLLRAESKEIVAERLEEVMVETFDYPLNSVYFPEDEMSVPARTLSGASSLICGPSDIEDNQGAQIAEAYRSGETVVAKNLCDVDLPVDAGALQTAAFLPIPGHGLMSIGREEDSDFSSFDLRLLEILSTHASVVLDRIEHEETLRHSEQRFRKIFENAAHGIALVGADGRILETNPALQQLLDLDAEELRGQHFESVTYSEDVATDRHLFRELVEGQREHYEIEKRFVRADGQVFWGTLTASRYAGPGQAAVIGMVENIDDRKRHKQKLKEAKEEAEEMSRLKSAFLANMSHEIRTPLTSILGFAEAIEEAAPDDSTTGETPIAKFAGLIEKSGTRLLETLDAVLALSKLEAESMDLSLTRLDLAQEIAEIADSFEQRATSEGVILHVDLPDSPLQMKTDQGAFRRILRNLISNALKYTDEGGDVWVRGHENDGRVVLEVEDTGIGMDPEHVTNLFDPFEQESTGTNRTYEGSGLGLPIVDRLVDKMDGSIEVETEKGVGTCVTIRLPLNPDEAPSE